MHAETDGAFHSFLFYDGLEAHGDDRKWALDPSMPEASLPILACQGDYASAISPLRLGRFLNEDEEQDARLPFVVQGGPRAHRFAVTNGWKRRESMSQAIGEIFRSSQSHGCWNVSLRPFEVEGETAGWAIYLRRFRDALSLKGELTDEPHPGAPPWTASSGGFLNPSWADYLLVDAGDNATHAYACEVLFAPTVQSAKSLAVKAAWRDLNSHPRVTFKHPVDQRFRWLRLRPWREIMFGDSIKIGIQSADGSCDSVWRSASRL
jgi:hypothetical protein